MAKKIKSFPTYMYHREHPEGRRVDDQDQATDLENSGWRNQYIWKEYPKMVNGILCKDPETEKLLKQAQANVPEKVKVVKDHIIKAPSGSMPDKKIAVQSPGMPGKDDLELEDGEPEATEATEVNTYEMIGSDGKAIPDMHFTSFKAAQAKQKELNANEPGHKARKI
jgi:hypothetical protein